VVGLEQEIPFYFYTVKENEQVFKPHARRTLIPSRDKRRRGEQRFRDTVQQEDAFGATKTRPDKGPAT
jgi:hypothetical protein